MGLQATVSPTCGVRAFSQWRRVSSARCGTRRRLAPLGFKGFRVQGLGCRVGLGFRLQGSGFRIWVEGCGFPGSVHV